MLGLRRGLSPHLPPHTSVGVTAACTEIAVRVAPRRAGDPAVLIASSEKIRGELGWQPEFQDLRIIIQSAWDWLVAHPKGYDE